VHMIREGQNVSQLRLLKQGREQCVDEKQMLEETRRTNPQLWSVMEKDMRKKRRNFDITTPTASEPVWSRIAVEREEEFFQGERYARIKSGARYKIAKDGSCKVIVEESKKAELDDGTYRYELNLVKRTGTKHNSSGGLRSRLPSPVTDGAILKVVGHDTVAGEVCDYLAASSAQRIKTCYWATMHHYPGSQERPVILKAIVPVGKDKNTVQAILFDRPARIDSSVFVPAKDIAIKDRSRRGGR